MYILRKGNFNEKTEKIQSKIIGRRTKMNSNNTLVKKDSFAVRLKKDFQRNMFAYLLILPAIILVFVFSYLPIGGIKMAFQDYDIYFPEGSAWVGFDNFISIFKTPGLLKAIGNTFYLSILSLIVGFPGSIIFAILLNEVKNIHFKKVTQTLSYLPHFLSWISVIGIASTLLSTYGPLNDLVELLGGERVMYLAEQKYFVPLLLILSVWKGLGWGSIVYLAAIAGVDQSLYEAVKIDGGGKWCQIWHITLPSIRPTIVIMLIWQLGGLFNSNFELVYGLQNSFIDFEVMSTIIYKRGIEGGEYSMSTALGVFQGVVNLVLIVVSNYFAKKVSETSLF